MDNYEEGDRVYLFGFSRGAYTVRALSGMLHMLGLIRKGDDNLIAYAADMLKRPDQMKIARAFKKTFSRECKVHFIGVWDTVSSVGWIWDPVHIPYTYRNPGLAIGRHAIAIDERRCYFRQNLWGNRDPVRTSSRYGSPACILMSAEVIWTAKVDSRRSRSNG